MADKTADAVKFLLRLPRGLHRRLLQQAKRNNVSLNTEIVNQLESHESTAVNRLKEWLKPAIENTIKEVFYRPPGQDLSEWIINPPDSQAAKEPENK
jgi:HicB-like protein involved in pilus formation